MPGWFLWAPRLQESSNGGKAELGLWWWSLKHFAGYPRGVGTFLNWQVLTFLSQRVGSLLLNNEHCRFTVQNCTHISFTCRCLISIPITNSMHRQSSIVSTLRINHILFKKNFDICISKLLPILNIYSTKLGKIVVLFQIIPAPWALPQNVKLQNIWDWNLTPVLPCCEVSLMKNILV